MGSPFGQGTCAHRGAVSRGGEGGPQKSNSARRRDPGCPRDVGGHRDRSLHRLAEQAL